MKLMKWHSLILIVALSSTLLTGCVNPNGSPDNTGTGALSGAAIGAFSGAVIGGPRNGGAGALIGAAAGAIAGGLFGHAADQQQEAELRAQAPQTYVRIQQGQPLSTADVKAMGKAGVSEDVIISQIISSHTAFHLSAADIIDLHDAGVTTRVVNFMINTQNSAGQPADATTIVSQEPPLPPVETMTPAPSPDYVWVGGEWIWNGRWVWVVGHWGLPPYGGAVWVRGAWVRGPYGWGRRPGHWH
jgi:outer membrane lipoprotein SlyB